MLNFHFLSCLLLLFKCNHSTPRHWRRAVLRIKINLSRASMLKWGSWCDSQQKGLQSVEGAHERHQNVPVRNGRPPGRCRWQGENTQIVPLFPRRLITKKYKEYTEEYLKLLEAQQEEEKKAKEQNEVKVKSSLNSQVTPKTCRMTPRSKIAARWIRISLSCPAANLKQNRSPSQKNKS
jgi:hypothetical protein